MCIRDRFVERTVCSCQLNAGLSVSSTVRSVYILPSVCVDVNECLCPTSTTASGAATARACILNAECINTVGSYQCQCPVRHCSVRQYPVLHCPVLQCPSLRSGPSISIPAMSTPAKSSVIVQSCNVQSCNFSVPLITNKNLATHR